MDTIKNYLFVVPITLLELLPFVLGRTIHTLTWQKREVINTFNFISSAELFLLFSILLEPLMIFLTLLFLFESLKKVQKVFSIKILLIISALFVLANVLFFTNYTTVFLNTYLALGHITIARWLVFSTIVFMFIIVKKFKEVYKI